MMVSGTASIDRQLLTELQKPRLASFQISSKTKRSSCVIPNTATRHKYSSRKGNSEIKDIFAKIIPWMRTQHSGATGQNQQFRLAAGTRVSLNSVRSCLSIDAVAD